MHITPTRPAASRRNSDFARDAVFTEFSGRDAKAVDQGAFVDRVPDQAPRRRRQAVLERLAHALLVDGDGDDVESQAA